MRKKGAPIALVAALLAAISTLSCERAVPWISTSRAPWSYVETAWGGIALGDPTLEGDRVALPLRLGLHKPQRVDSAICVRRASARPEEGRILVRFDKCVCGPGAERPFPSAAPHRLELVASFDKPSPGKYPVVYDDASAGYPRLGEVEVGK